MKKTIYIIAALASMIAAGCSKSDTKTTTPTPAPITGTGGVITINGTTYNGYVGKDTITTDFFGASGNLFVGAGATSDSQKLEETFIIFNGNMARPTAGSYHVGVTGTNFVDIVVEDSSAAGEGLYSSDSVTSNSITVSINSGKITTTLPSMRLHGLYTPAGGSTYNDTITISGTVIEQ